MQPERVQQFDPITSPTVRSLRIALAVNLLPSKIGSLEQWILWFIREAKASGYSVDLICRGTPIPEIGEALANLGATVISLEELYNRPLRAIKLLASYDIIHLNLFGLRERLPLLAYCATPAKVLFTDHISRHFISKKSGIFRKLFDKLSAVRIHSFAAVSEFIAHELSGRIPNKSSKIRAIYNGVDTERFAPTIKQPRAFHIVTTAHLIAEKGVDLIIKAFDRFTEKDSRLTIIGAGPELNRLKALAHSLWLDKRISFLGEVSNVEQVLGSADIFVHAARWLEAFGLGVAEAMACGLPIVAPKSGAMPELIQDGVNGLLVQPDSVTAICEALERLRDSDILRHKLAKNARREAVARFSLEQSVREHINWCKEVADERISSIKD